MTDAPAIGLLVDREMERRLRAAAPGVHYDSLPDWVELAFYDLESHPVAFIVDPGLLAAEHRIRTLSLLGSRRAPVILYVRMTPSLAGLLLEIARLGIGHIMVFGMDDRASEVRKLIREALARCIRREQS